MPDPSDPLASATLAQLYISQGHAGRARRVIDQILSEEAHHGAALALRKRLEMHGHTALSVELEPSCVRVRWRLEANALDDHALHVLVQIHWRRRLRRGSIISSRATSSRCEVTNGTARFQRPAGPGSISVALAHLDEGRQVRILAAAEPLSWST
jgi:hypothetical protein